MRTIVCHRDFHTVNLKSAPQTRTVQQKDSRVPMRGSGRRAKFRPTDYTRVDHLFKYSQII